MKSEDVGIANEKFFVASIMKDCPASTIIRELLRNAIEAASQVKGGTGEIRWKRCDWDGVSKLVLYNEGPGMDENELRERMKIASTSHKLGFNDNFGMGAKLSGGKASPYGLVYRSCKNNMVHEAWLQVETKDDGTKRLVLVAQHDPYNDDEALIIQVTNEMEAKGYSLDHEWTEVVILGRTKHDNTINEYFLDQSTKNSALWLMAAINRRFYRFPPGIIVRDAHVTTPRYPRDPRNARGLEKSLSAVELTQRREVVCVPAMNINNCLLGDVDIVYGRLAGKPSERSSGPLAADGIGGGSHVCLVYKDEIYDFDTRWVLRAGSYGFSSACEDYYVHILIPDNAAIQNNTHRTAIQTRDERAAEFECVAFASTVRDNRPDWVIDDINMRQEEHVEGEVERRLKKLAEQLKAKTDTYIVEPNTGNDEGTIEVTSESESHPHAPPGPPDPSPPPQDPMPPDDAENPARNGKQTCRGRGKAKPRPRPDTLTARFKLKKDSPQWYEKVEGRAGSYDKTDNVIWLSQDFSEYRRLEAWVNREWPEHVENGLAIGILGNEYRMFAAQFGMGALTFRHVPSWSPEDWEKGLTPEAISTCLVDPGNIIEKAVRKEIRRKLGTIQREPEETTSARRD